MVVVLLVIIGFLLALPSATAIGKVCGNAGNYTANGTYHSNLVSLAATLPNNTSSSPQLFATATAGQGPDVVYALALCRGDITNNITGCGNCIAGSFQYAQKMCTYHKAASVYDDDCLLGFSNNNFLVPANNNVTQDNSTLFQFWNFVGNTTVAAADVRYLLTQTAQEAATRPTRFTTAFMDASSSANPTLYSLAQCTPDLSAGDCLACLQWIVSMVNATTTSVQNGGRILVLRCNVRFETFLFYDGTPMKRITPSSAPPTPPIPAPTPMTNKSM
jgi:hypothetical protein